jgi:hypothetical protein
VPHKQERYLLIELEVAKGKAEGRGAIADVNVSYLDPKTKARAKVAGTAQVSFSASSEEATRSANASVAADVAAQLANERSEKAVLARDAGKVADAKQQLEQNAAVLRAEANRLQAQSPRSQRRPRPFGRGRLWACFADQNEGGFCERHASQVCRVSGIHQLIQSATPQLGRVWRRDAPGRGRTRSRPAQRSRKQRGWPRG